MTEYQHPRDPQGRDPNDMHRHYLTTPLYEGQTMGFPSPNDINLLVETARHAALLMGYLYGYFYSQGVKELGHIMDSDDNPGEYLRRDLRALGFWNDEVRPVAKVKVRICRTSVNAPDCRCKVDDDLDCITCGERRWADTDHNCAPGFHQ